MLLGYKSLMHISLIHILCMYVCMHIHTHINPYISINISNILARLLLCALHRITFEYFRRILVVQSMEFGILTDSPQRLYFSSLTLINCAYKVLAQYIWRTTLTNMLHRALSLQPPLFETSIAGLLDVGGDFVILGGFWKGMNLESDGSALSDFIA